MEKSGSGINVEDPHSATLAASFSKILPIFKDLIRNRKSEKNDNTGSEYTLLNAQKLSGWGMRKWYSSSV
jgi:hypothetical protein